MTIFALSGTLAFLLRFDFSIPHGEMPSVRLAIPVWMVAKVICFRIYGLDRGWWRYVSVPDILRIGIGNLLGSVAAGVVIFFFSPPGFPRSLYALDFLICLMATAGIRVATRMAYEAGTHSSRNLGTRILIYGAGVAGQALVREIRSNSQLGFTVCGFVDDDNSKRGAILNGIKVLGAGADLASLVNRHQVQEILIALPAATGAELTRVLRLCRAAEFRCKTIPGMAELIGQQGLVSQIREVAVEDVLGTNPVRLEVTRIRARLEGQVVAVPGAPGSIGSELC